MTSHYTRSKAHRPSASILEEGDVELTGAATSTVDISVRSTAEAVVEPGSMAAEPAGPVCVPIRPSPAGLLSSEGGLGTPEPAGSPQVGFTLGYPSGLAGPTEASARVSGQMFDYTDGYRHHSTPHRNPLPSATATTPRPVTAAARDGCRYRPYIGAHYC